MHENGSRDRERVFDRQFVMELGFRAIAHGVAGRRPPPRRRSVTCRFVARPNRNRKHRGAMLEPESTDRSNVFPLLPRETWEAKGRNIGGWRENVRQTSVALASVRVCVKPVTRFYLESSWEAKQLAPAAYLMRPLFAHPRRFVIKRGPSGCSSLSLS